MQNFAGDEFLTPYESEYLIKDLSEIDIREYGSKKWVRQQENLDRLNIQAHKNAIASTEEFVMETVTREEKIEVLIHQLLTCEAWKQKLLPLMAKHLSSIPSFKSYLALYHESTLVNLLEVILYHRTACESSDDALVELMGYCYRKFVTLLRNTEKGDLPKPLEGKDLINKTPEQDLNRNHKEIDFQTAVSCLSLIRFISDHMLGLSVPVVHTMMQSHDMPLILVPILEAKPWFRTNLKGEEEKFEDQKWQVIKPEDQGKLCKTEAQVWLTLYNMFLTQDSNRKYEITTNRKNNLLRLRKFMNEALIDQLPMLGDMQRALEELSIMQESNIPSSNPFIVQQMPDIRNRIYNNRDWNEIAQYQKQNFFTANVEEAKEEMEKLMKLYSSDAFDEFMEDPICSNCGKPATQRCSKCKNQWYCSRDCQLRQWKGHKALCAVISEQVKRAQEEKPQVEQQKKKKPLIEEVTKE